MSGLPTLAYLLLHFALLSLLAFGGANTIIPELHRQAVEVTGWMSDAEFADLFAIAQAAPGPNTMIVTLIGWRAAGLVGALVATMAICLPAALLTFVVLHVWERFRDAPWREIVQRGLTPVTVGLVAASAYLLARATTSGLREAAITLVVAVLCFSTRLNPLWPLGVAAAIGYAGVLNGG